MNLSFRASRAPLTLLSVAVWGWVGLTASLSLTAAELAIIKGNRAHLRSSPSLKGEEVGTVTKGERLIVLENIPAVNPQPDDPISWAKVGLPNSVKVWVFAQYVDAKTGTVTSQELKVRSGPGKNYAAVGMLKKGDDVEMVQVQDGWMQIEVPDNAVAYIASDLIEITGLAPTAKNIAALATPTLATPTPPPSAAGRTSPALQNSQAQPLDPEPMPEPVRAPIRRQPSLSPDVTTPPAIAQTENLNPTLQPTSVIASPGSTPPLPSQSILPPIVAPFPTNSAPAVSPSPNITAAPVDISSSVQYRQPELVYNENQPRRVLREGLVAMAMSPDAPTLFQLDSFRRREGALDYLMAEDPKEFVLSKWRGKRVFIEGDEYRDRRWRTPVLKIRSIRAAY